MDDTEGWQIDAGLAMPHLESLGWTVEWVRWRAPDVNWSDYDAVYIGTPWDYPEDPDRFLDVLEAIDRSSALLINCMELVRWNLQKTYLRDLQSRGADIVPSIWCKDSSDLCVEPLFDRLQSEGIIVKPVVSTNATDTFLLNRENSDAIADRLRDVFAKRACIIQPFMSNIRSEGEFSLFYFNGQLSHAIQKVPKHRDFRVQEEHGATLTLVPPETALQAVADQILSLVEPTPVYARCDLVRHDDGRFLLMELELIEPSMYLRMKKGADRLFAAALDAAVSGGSQALR